MKKYIKVIFLSFAVYVSCASPEKIAGDRIRNQPHKQLENFHYNFKKPVPGRIADVPGFFLQYLKDMDSMPSYRTYSLSEKEQELFVKYYGCLPGEIKDLMENRLVAVYFIEHFIGGGMTEYIFDKKGRMYIVLILNPATLKTSLEEWISYRDNAFFTNDGRTFAYNDLGREHKGLLHTLVHESAHIFDYLNMATPYTEPDLKYFGYNKEETVFTGKFWLRYFVPESRYDFENRADIKPYGLGNTVESGRQVRMYMALGRTPFVSLYGAMSWAEDYAETFAWFYLAEKLNIIYSVRVTENGETKVLFEPLKNATAQQRYRQIIEQMSSVVPAYF